MPQLVAIKFRYSPKHLWFDPKNSSYQLGDHVLVETERGREVGLVVNPDVNATDKQVAELKTPLKPVVRLLTDFDYDHIDVLDQKGRQALPQFKELVQKHQLDMKPIDVEYLFSGDRAVFYFSSDERVDFRELVKELSAQFHVRVDMRQIGARDEARMVGGLGHCGQELCCARFGSDFQPVSIRMAKEQDLPLNPAKISGACGRLMCCLRYEYEAYKDFKKRAPKKGSLVNTPLGLSKIIGYDTPRERLQLRLEDGKTINIPMAEMICEKDEKGCNQCSVSRETIDRCASSSMLLALSALDRELGNLEDKLADGEIERQVSVRVEQAPRERTRRRRSGGGESKTDTGSGSGFRANSNSSSSSGTGSDSNSKNDSNREAMAAAESKDRGQSKPRPGQKSSGLRRRRTGSNKNSGGAGSGASGVSGASGNSAKDNNTNSRNSNSGGRNGNNNSSNSSSNNSPSPTAGQNSNRKRRRRSTGGSNNSDKSSNSNDKQ